MLGGDSDIQLHVDIRGKALTDLCTGLHSQSISGNDDVDVGAKWNFRSATVSPEKKSFCVPRLFTLSTSYATSKLDQGSDHRVVYAGLDFPKTTQYKRKKKNNRI